MKTTKKKATKKVAKKKVSAKAAVSGLNALVETAKQIADLESELTTVRQKSNIAVLADRIKILVLFGTKERLKIRSRFFKETEKDVEHKTLVLKRPKDSQVLSTARVLIQRALSDKKGGK